MEKLEEQFVPFLIAQLLDRLQFNYYCQAFYNPAGELIFCKPIRNSEVINDAISAPTYQQATDYLRTKHKIHVAASSFPVYGGYYGFQYGYQFGTSGGWTVNIEGKTYYDALTKGLQEAISNYLIKDGKKAGKK